MNSVAGKRQRLLRRVFQHKSGSDETASPQKAPISPKSSNLLINGRKQNEIDLSLNLRLADSKQSDGPSLWTEVYNLFAASTASPDLQTVAKLLHDQSKALSSSTVNDRNRDTKASREWHLCREILHAAESKQSELKKGSETPIMRQLKHACNEIITWTQKFVALGDMISQVDPVHIGLPWAGIRAILVVCAQS